MMKFLDLRAVIVVAFAAVLAGCGAGTNGADPAPQAPQAHAGAVADAYAVQPGQPQPDCAADGCSVPRVIDGLAEQFRAAAMEQPATDETELPQAADGQAPAREADAAQPATAG